MFLYCLIFKFSLSKDNNINFNGNISGQILLKDRKISIIWNEKFNKKYWQMQIDKKKKNRKNFGNKSKNWLKKSQGIY